MANWKAELRIRHLLDGEIDEEKIKELAKQASEIIVKFCEAQSKNDWFSEADILELKDIAEAFRDTVDDVESFNSCLAELYDFCDYNLIWVPLMSEYDVEEENDETKH